MSRLLETSVVNKISIAPDRLKPFVDWQAKLHAAIAGSPGFVSLEILTPSGAGPQEWVVVERFNTAQELQAWRNSVERRAVFDGLPPLLDNGESSIQEVDTDSLAGKGCITEVFITQVNPQKEAVFREWIARIHQEEAKFPGFRGVYVQSPTQAHGKNWITLLQFDTPENLDLWINSPERASLLRESKGLIASIETHKLVSPYAGWFASVSQGVEAPAVWKQAMIVLLMLFPVVMLELKWLNPHLAGINPAAATFIGNAISVSLVSWPLVPIAIYFLGWWLTPDPLQRWRATIYGTLVVLACYGVEIALLWKLL